VRACGPQPEEARSSACLANRNRFMIDHRLSRQNVKLFLREPLDQDLLRYYVHLHVALERPSASLERQVLLLDLLGGLIVRFAENRPSPRSLGSQRQAVRRACDYLAEHYARRRRVRQNVALGQREPKR
jgi:hypothetical protein